MISSLTGTVAGFGAGWVNLVVSGVGFRIETPGSIVLPGGTAEITLHTSLVVREDSLTLFGFQSTEDRDGFGVLMGVSGIGPRLALAAVDTIGLDDLRRAVAQADLTTLQRIPGVGRKTAQRMVLEIGDRLGTPSETTGAETPKPAAKGMRADVGEALEQLGWPRVVAEKAIDDLGDDYATTADLLRAALLSLGGPRGI